MSSMWGERIRLSIFGGSHTEAIGMTLDGLPGGEEIQWEQVLAQMARRAPGQEKSATPRVEKDEPHVLSGFYQGKTTGAPLTAVIQNTNQHSKDYDKLRDLPRPGHSDYTAQVRYGGHQDIRGGGHFSGRLTAPLVLAGAICRQILARRGILIAGHVAEIAGVQDAPLDPVNPDPAVLQELATQYFPALSPKAREAMRVKIEEARLSLDSVGGIVECMILGLPAGAGNPMFAGVENLISSLVFGIPAVKGIAFGAGFQAAEMRGSTHNDPFYYDQDGTVKTKTNHAGGILGGITNGMPVVFRAVIKPTPSISQRQDTVNLRSGCNDVLEVQGRHDPCIVPRAVPAVEAAAAVSVMELLAQSGML